MFFLFLFLLLFRQAAKINLLLCFMPVPYGSHPVQIFKFKLYSGLIQKIYQGASVYHV